MSGSPRARSQARAANRPGTADGSVHAHNRRSVESPAVPRYGARMTAVDESQAATASGASVQSVDRALTILELLARDGEAGVTEIAAELGRAQVDGVPAAGHPRVAPPGRAGRRPRALPARRGQPPAGRRHDGPARPRHRGAAGLPAAGDRHRRDRQHHRPQRDQRPLPRPGRGQQRAADPQLGRAAHPAARDQQRQGAAQRAERGRPQGGAAGAAAVHRRDRDEPHGAQGRAGRRCARPGTPSRSTSSRWG